MEERPKRVLAGAKAAEEEPFNGDGRQEHDGVEGQEHAEGVGDGSGARLLVFDAPDVGEVRGDPLERVEGDDEIE